MIPNFIGSCKMSYNLAKRYSEILSNWVRWNDGE